MSFRPVVLQFWLKQSGCHSLLEERIEYICKRGEHTAAEGILCNSLLHKMTGLALYAFVKQHLSDFGAISGYCKRTTDCVY